MPAPLAPCPPEQGSVVHAKPTLLQMKEGQEGIVT